MDAKTLTALQGSIAKWEAIVDGTGSDKGWTNCPLCLMFNNDDDDDQRLLCDGCPVADAVENQFCENTPLDEWGASFMRREERAATTPERKRLAQAELDFLRSLLPAEAA